MLLVAVFEAFNFVSTTANCLAQGGEDVARGLLRALIESQLEKSGSRGGTELAPGQRRASRSATPELQQLRVITSTFAQEAATLGALLQTDSRRSIEARRLLPDAIRLQATSAALQQQLVSQTSHQAVVEDFRGLNQQWAGLTHQLGQCRALSEQTTACMQRLAALDVQYSSLLGIREQFDNAQLTRAAWSLTTYLRDLTEDVQGQPQTRDASRQQMRELGQLNHKANYFAGLVSQGAAYPAVVTEYRDLYRGWTNIEKMLAGYTNHTVARSMRRIRDSHQEIHQLLRLEMSRDRELVLNLIHDIDHQLEDLFRSLTLQQLMTLPDAGVIPDIADAVQGNIQNIDDLVHRNESAQSVGDAWIYTLDAWSQFSFHLRGLQDPAIAFKVSAVGETMQSLQQALGITVAFDQNALMANAASLEVLAERLLTTLRRWQSSPGQHDRTLITKTEQMSRHFANIKRSVVSGSRRRNHLQECDSAIQVWQQIRPALKTCTTAEREQFDYIAATLTPEIVRLRTMLDE
jgi:sulfur relay (sulfurtransferase) DsrC/TusE family protein